MDAPQSTGKGKVVLIIERAEKTGENESNLGRKSLANRESIRYTDMKY